MRRVFLDTETTGFEISEHRLVEVGAVEMIDRKRTGRELRFLVNPERSIPLDATEVHGIRDEDVADAPKFSEIADQLLEFVDGSELCIHNAGFDVPFLNMELERAKRRPIDKICTIFDTLKFAKETDPGRRSSLDALCDRFGVNNKARTVHGALLDAQLLAEVWLSMTRGQESFLMDAPPPPVSLTEKGATEHHHIIVTRPTKEELDAHEAYLVSLRAAAKGGIVWDRMAEDVVPDDTPERGRLRAA